MFLTLLCNKISNMSPYRMTCTIIFTLLSKMHSFGPFLENGL